jgi:hypothetical protein
MSNRLRAYVKRTILAAAREYAGGKRNKAAREDALRAALIDAMRGTDTGWWTDLIYTAPMLDMAHRYRRGIAAALDAYREETGEPFVYHERAGDGAPVTADKIATALLRGPYTYEQYHRDVDDGAPEATLLGLRFAVEWYAGEVARELAPDL